MIVSLLRHIFTGDIMKIRWLHILIMGIVLGCTSNVKHPYTAELLKSRQIKKISQAEILQTGMDLGIEIVNEIAATLNKNILDSVNCETLSNGYFTSIENSNHVTIRRVTTQSERLKEMEANLLEAYQYHQEQGLISKSSIQKVNKTQVLFACPVQHLALLEKCANSDTAYIQIWFVYQDIKHIIQNM